MWTTIRAASPVFGLALGASVFAAIGESRSDAVFLPDADYQMRLFAPITMISWLMHLALMFGITQQFGTPKINLDASVHPTDLMDSAPIRPHEQFIGEFEGILLASVFIHACCLPLLLVDAALSPLPMLTFAWLEMLIIALIVLASAAAAWRRIVIRGAVRSTRGLRSIALFFLLVTLVIMGTTTGALFRDSLVAFIGGPSMRAWGRLMATVDAPVAMLVLLGLIYAGYLAFFYVSATRARVAD